MTYIFSGLKKALPQPIYVMSMLEYTQIQFYVSILKIRQSYFSEDIIQDIQYQNYQRYAPFIGLIHTAFYIGLS